MRLNRWVIGFVTGVGIACATAAIPPLPTDPQPPPAVNRALQPLHVGGPVSGSPASFRYPDGTEYRWKGISDFSLFWRYLNGENIEPVLQDRVNVGVNLVRVLGMVSWQTGFSPQQHADYFDKLRAFVDLLAAHGLRIEFVVFADAQILMPNQAEQLAHWNRVIVTLGDKNNVFLQVANQSAKNGVDTSVFPVPQYPQLLASRDNPFESSNPPPANGFAYNVYCSSRSPVKWFVEQGSSMYYLIFGWGQGEPWQGTHGISVLDEPMGASETDQPGRRSNNVNAFKQLARSLVWGNGATFHCDDCIQSVLLRPIQHDAAVEFEANLP